MSLLLAIVLFVHALMHLSAASLCSDLDLSTSNKNTDENYSILIDKIPSSNVIRVSLMRNQGASDTSWFLMGASDSSKLIGSWQPFTLTDGEIVDCSTSSGQVVTNRHSVSQRTDQSQFTFYWMPPSTLSTSVVFVATIFYTSPTGETSTLRYVQSLRTEIEQTPGRDRYQDVSPTFCDSSPCLNGGACIRDPQFSYCRCVAPWNGVFCSLQYFHIMLASTQPFTSEFYFNTLNSPSYANLSTSIVAWLNSAFSGLPPNRIYSINSVSPSPLGTYLSISMALTPTSGVFAPTILSALAVAILRNNTTPFGQQLSISQALVSAPVTQDGAPYTSCVFPFTLALVDYNFCVPFSSNFICSASRVIDRNTTLNSLDCSRNIFNYITRDPCFPNICLNGGTCVTVNNVATCTCPDYFTGARCDQLYGCNPLTNSRAVTCTNGATCVGNICVCTSSNNVGALCEIVAGNTGCNFPFNYMGVSYSACAVINNQPLCVARTAGSSGQFPVSLVGCGAPQCQNNPCGNRGTCQDTVSGAFRCINCASGFSGYFCELQYRTVQLSFNTTYTPDLLNSSSNASKILQGMINQTLTTAFANITNGGVRPDLITFIQNPDGTTSAVINVNTNYLNFQNNATQNALNRIGAIVTVLVNTTRDCAPWYIYEGRNASGCVTNSQNVPICSLTNNFDRDGQFTACSEPINLGLCNGIFCGDGRCIVTSRNLTYCRCPNGVTGVNCDQLLQCSDVNCLNNGTCVRLPTGNFRCVCAPGFGGTYCQYNIVGCKFPFVDNQNRTQNTCILTSDYMAGTVPWCRNSQNVPISCAIDYCAQRPCRFGVCVPSSLWAFGNSYPAFVCNCTNGYTGRLCTHAYFRIKALYAAPNISNTVLNALESPTTQAYQNLTNMFRDLIRNRTNSSFDFLPLIFTTFRTDEGNFFQVTADASYPGNISQTQIMNILRPILANLPPQFNVKFDNTSLTDIDDVQPLNPASNCTLPYGYNTQSLAVCHMDSNNLAYCSYGLNYTLIDRKLCDASGLPTAQYTACENLNLTNPCNSTPNFPIRCVASDNGWTCFCEVTQTLGRDCGNLDFCRNGSLLCRNNASCINRPDLMDFACNCSDPYYGRLCENFGRAYKIFLVNYSNETSPGAPTLISMINQTIINMTNGGVIATSISISPNGEVTIIVTGRNYSIPDFEIPLTDKVRSNWTVGPFVVAFNQTSLVTIQTNASCVFPFAYNGVNYTRCITTGYDFPWCSTTAIFSGRIVDCRNIDWCASGPCLNNGTCSINMQLGTFQCKCVDGWTGVQCAYPSTTITIVVPLGNNTFNNITLLNITNSLPNNTNIDIIKLGPNNTVIIVIVVNNTNIPNITFPTLNVTREPTKNVDGCVFPYIYNNETYYSCIPVFQNRSTYCCQNPNCDLNPRWQFCNGSNVCAACASYASCALATPIVVICTCPTGYSGNLCETPLDLCAQRNRSCLNNGVCVVNPLTGDSFCNCSSPSFVGIRCDVFLPCLLSPCLNNGACSAFPNATVRCNCSNCYSGPLCQNIDYCCLNVCSPNGACIPGLNNGYTCFCQPNFAGVNCSTFNPCAQLPCLNGGTCTVAGATFQCLCPPGWAGTNCGIQVNPCASFPCRNNGQCNSLGNGFVCICPSGFNGTLCDLPINPCGSNPCFNGGSCYQQLLNAANTSPGAFGYVCVCNTTLFSGTRCETILSPCPTNPALPSPCRNGGVCIPTANGLAFTCLCPYPYTGLVCDQQINPCSPNPCLPFGQCYLNAATSNFTCVCINTSYTGPLCQNLVNPCASSPCVNGSTCIPIGAGFTCLCQPNRTGLYCESIVPPCTNTTCFNNGTCLYSSTSVTCLCPPLFTGPQCLQRVDPCSSTPCLNNGTCLTQFNTFICSCPLTRTGILCENLINPCLTYFCFFGGTCLLDSQFRPTCLCPPTQTGLFCETSLDPCSSRPCLNNGTCLTNSQRTNYACTCPPLYTGARCENLLNPCLPNRCIFGTCYTLANGTFYCACAPSYTGLICDHPIDQCALLPCLNNGTCINLGTTYLCFCSPTTTGRSCEQTINPCLSNPCRSGTCYSTGTRYVCACDASRTGLLCEISLDPCLSYPCLNNQTCLRDGTNTSYTCLCLLPYTGARCGTTVLPCSTVTCLNGGTCIQTTLSTTQCLCATGFSGTFCEIPLSVCQSRPCLNNGTCLSTFTNSFMCMCAPGYTGTFCEQFNPCVNLICLNGGTCAISPSAIGGRVCICPPSFTGTACEIPITPCASSPCVNNGLCIITPGTSSFTCICTPTFTGVFCETYINPCTNYLCANGGTCYRTVDGRPICACTPTYTGAQCFIRIDPCLSNPCVNNGICLPSSATYNYTCLCPTNYTGYRCENYIGACTPTICQNGGTCVYNGLNAIACICPPTWTGTLCGQRVDPCATANPCLNSGICIAIFNSTSQTTVRCQCLAAYTGQYCETPISPCQNLPCVNGQCLLRADGSAMCYCNAQWTGTACDTAISPCVSQPCLNSGICYATGVGYSCICTQGYSGARCEITPPNRCTSTCANNGTCAIRGQDNVQICVCPSGYTGSRCEIQISPCVPSPCLNNGVCISATNTNGSLGFLCICPAPYTGQICATVISITCGNFTCLNGGTCLVSGDRTICLCPSLFTGTRCESLINSCDSNPCVNGGTCTAISMGRKKRQTSMAMGYFCQCLSTYTGTRCEQFLSLCGSNPCRNNGTCLQDTFANRIYCLCLPNYTGTFCDIPAGPNICATNPSICVNGGTCRVNVALPQGYSCICPPTTTGFYCEQLIDLCRTFPTPCLNNGTCVTSLTGYMCLCPAGFTGMSCSIPTSPCSSQPCFRNGTCLAIGTQSYTCICPTNYFGTRCEICNCPCNIYPCLNGGVCRSTPAGGVVCTCPAGYTGVRCETSLLPCDSNPCQNMGVCIYDPLTMKMTCQCCGLSTGTFCETMLNPCNNSIPYCFNGGTCYLDANAKPMCMCPSTFTGLYCETYSNPCSLATCIQGTCVVLANSSFLCICPSGRSGRYCEIADPCIGASGTLSPCRNGGTCIRLSGTSYSCICAAGFTGANCDVANPCASMPCAANATCATLLNGSAVCLCPPGTTGSRCNRTIVTPFCSSSPCRNNGICVGSMCLCPNNTSGATCNVTRTPCPTATRPALTCANGGTCVVGYGCFCDSGFGGVDCETPLSGDCTSSTCSNGGTCVILFNGTLSCTCPPGYTGLRCETFTTLCQPNPCQSNGTCIPSGSAGYMCICPPSFTGPQCNLVSNPCLYTPCLNSGTCTPQSNGGYSCMCLPMYTGTQCQTLLNPCLSSPCNAGTCLTINNGLAYTCNCPPQLTGPNCLGANPCGLQPCLNGGTCSPTSMSTYTCVCPPNYTGTNCQTLNLCLPNPCTNGGTCQQLTLTTVSCLCPAAFYGPRCETVNPCRSLTCVYGICQINPTSLLAQCACYAGWTGTTCNISLACLSNPCLYGTCVSSGSGGYVCNCIPGYFGLQCQTPIARTPCESNPCRNGGTCQVTATNGYICSCPAYYIGMNCEAVNPCVLTGAPASCQPVLTSTGNYTCSCSSNPCASNPCQFGSCTVINSGTAYRCMCFPGYVGRQCNLPDPCDVTTCYNGGTCVSTVNDASTQVTQSCICPPSQHFVGQYCEHYNPCISSPCASNATCSYFINVTCYYYCTCPPGYSGERCQFSLSQTRCESLGIPNNCRNGGTCLLVGGSTQCFCASMYTGALCENMLDMCSLRVCQNGATCRVVNGSSISCQCPPTFQGKFCEYSTDPCAIRPCLNGGQCIASGSTFSCNCAQTMYTGPRCQSLSSSPCTPSPCANGGTCQTVGSSYVCVCPAAFTGPTCSQSLSLCSRIQCINGGTCSDYGTFAVCNCLINFTGERCQYINQCYPLSPCLNGGTCISVLSSFSCQCPVGRTGTTCQLFSDNPCTGGNRCFNGGTCVILSGTTDASCLCPANFTGQSCEQAISSVRTTSTTATLPSSIVTIVPERPSTIVGTTSMANFNTTTAPYSCDDASLACLAYRSYCSPEYEFSGVPCRVLCPRTCDTCCEDFYKDGTCSLETCRRNPELNSYCRKTCICKK